MARSMHIISLWCHAGIAGINEENKILMGTASNWTPADLMFCQHALPLLPLLVLGFITEEVYKLVRDETASYLWLRFLPVVGTRFPEKVQSQ